jgi:beta-1,4-mannosyl-glycoprotein beta-1,4-N-acetylglucosaminyltransferase
MIYDCFTFYNELELLDLRLRVLGPVVDRFVLVEATTTFTGKPKPLVYADNRERFAKYNDKIIYVGVTNSPLPTSPTNVWNVEYYQRNAIECALWDAPQDARIMVSDIDEIPHPESVAKHGKEGGIVGFAMHLYYYYVNCKQSQVWWGTVMASRRNGLAPQKMRDMRSACPYSAHKMGWHFSFLGGVERIQEKLAAFSETKVNTAKTSDSAHIQHCMETADDLFGRTERFAQKRFVPIDATYPDEIHGWLKEYPQMYKEIPCQT